MCRTLNICIENFFLHVNFLCNFIDTINFSKHLSLFFFYLVQWTMRRVFNIKLVFHRNWRSLGQKLLLIWNPFLSSLLHLINERLLSILLHHVLCIWSYRRSFLYFIISKLLHLLFRLRQVCLTIVLVKRKVLLKRLDVTL